MHNYELILPEDFSDYAWEVKEKGWFSGAIALFNSSRYKLTFYDPFRLAQEIEDELEHNPVFLEPNLLVLNSVEVDNMEKAIEVLARTGRYAELIEEYQK